MSSKTSTPVIGTSRWEDSDYIVTMDGKPIGMTLSEAQAGRVADWFRGVCTELPTLNRDDLFDKLVEALKGACEDIIESSNKGRVSYDAMNRVIVNKALLTKIEAAEEVGK